MRGINEIFVGTKGYLGTSGRGESYTPASAFQAGGAPAAPGGAEAFARTLPGLDSGLQRRRAGVFQFHHRRPVHRMDAAGRDKLAIPQREAVVGWQEPAIHQQREGQRVRQAQLPQGLGASGHHGLTVHARAWTALEQQTCNSHSGYPNGRRIEPSRMCSRTKDPPNITLSGGDSC